MAETVVVTAPDAAIAVLQPTLTDAIVAAEYYVSQAQAAQIAAAVAEGICNSAGAVAQSAAASATLSAAAAQAAASSVGFGTEPANKVFASPDGSGGYGVFRTIVNNDLPPGLAPASISVTSNATVGGTLGVTGATSLGAVSASGTVSGAGFSSYLASPPAIGLTTPAAAKFASLLSTSGSIISAPSLTIAPTGNPVTTLTSHNVQVSSGSSTTVEFLSAIGFAMNTASAGAYNGNVDPKVAQYVGGTCSSGCKAAWAENILMQLNTPLNAHFFCALTTESDYNNSSGNDFHNSYGALGAVTQYVGNLLVTGAGTNLADFAIAVGGLNTTTSGGMYNRGILFLAGLGAVQTDIQSESSAVSVLADFGTHATGIDLKATAYSGTAIWIHPTGSSGAGITSLGTYTVAAMTDASTAPYGLSLSGTYATAALYVGGAIQVTALSANGAVATALGSIGPTGSHTTVQEWIQVKGTGGVIRYIPGF